MKNLSITRKIILVFNDLFALLLLLAFISPYMPQGVLSVLSLSALIFPFLVLINVFFVIYWLVQFKKYFFISLLVLLINFNNIQAVYQWEGKHPIEPKGFLIMSYNVRLFNAYNWIKKQAVDVDISNYLKDQNPHILLLQEYRNDPKTDFTQYQYRHIVLKGKKHKAGLAIFSKFKIINSGNLDFADTYNNAIWADIVVQNDTLRVYNLHLQSYKIVNPDTWVEQDKALITGKLQKVFDKQREQADRVQQHIADSPYPVVVGGDFNNTAFSAPYRILKKNKNDAFVEAGEGFGITWRYKLLPLRIDFILSDKNRLEVLAFETLNHIKFSDHFPIKVRLRFKEF